MAIIPSKLPPISQKSTEDIWVSCRAEDPVTGEQNISGLTVEIAFTQDDDPEEGEWFVASWRSATPWVNPEDGLSYYLAQIKIGPAPGVKTFTKGNWLVWARLTTPTTKPVFGPSKLVII